MFSKQPALLTYVCANRRHVLAILNAKKPRWAREHLVDLERSEQIYLVIREQKVTKSIKSGHQPWAFLDFAWVTESPIELNYERSEIIQPIEVLVL